MMDQMDLLAGIDIGRAKGVLKRSIDLAGITGSNQTAQTSQMEHSGNGSALKRLQGRFFASQIETASGTLG